MKIRSSTVDDFVFRLRAIECYADFHLSHGIGIIDVLIAFTAVGLDAELLTFNTKHFNVVEGLRLRRLYEK